MSSWRLVWRAVKSLELARSCNARLVILNCQKSVVPTAKSEASPSSLNGKLRTASWQPEPTWKAIRERTNQLSRVVWSGRVNGTLRSCGAGALMLWSDARQRNRRLPGEAGSSDVTKHRQPPCQSTRGSNGCPFRPLWAGMRCGDWTKPPLNLKSQGCRDTAAVCLRVHRPIISAA